MFTKQQVLHYKTFGYVIMRNVFSKDEIKVMETEFETAMKREEVFTPKQGENSFGVHVMVGNDTPFVASLTEDERLYQPSKQVFGEDVVLQEWQGYQYSMINGTFWHCNDGDPTLGRYRYGARYQWPVFEPVRADTGALRILPGSHLREFQWELRKADNAGLLNDIGNVGSVVCEAELGDVVAFDTRVYHASAPHDIERRVISGIYYHFPETREETAVTAADFVPNTEQWNQWRANNPDRPFKRYWEELVARLERSARRCGYRTDKGKIVPD